MAGIKYLGKIVIVHSSLIERIPPPPSQKTVRINPRLNSSTTGKLSVKDNIIFFSVIFFSFLKLLSKWGQHLPTNSSENCNAQENKVAI